METPLAKPDVAGTNVVLIPDSDCKPCRLFSVASAESTEPDNKTWYWQQWQQSCEVAAIQSKANWPAWSMVIGAILASLQRFTNRDLVMVPAILLRQDGEGVPVSRSVTDLISGRQSFASFAALSRYVCSALAHSKDGKKSVPADAQIVVVLTDRALSENTREYVERFLRESSCQLALCIDRKTATPCWIWRGDGEVSETCLRLESMVRTVLQSAENRLDAPLASLEALDSAEQHRLRVYGAGETKTRPFEPVIAAIARHAQANPDREAVRCGSTGLTYGGLWLCAEALAGALSKEGVGKGSRVALFLPPSVDVSIALVAIHRLAAVYVPVDPSFPAARIESMLEFVEPDLLLVCSGTQDLVPDAYRAVAKDVRGMETGAEKAPLATIEPQDESHIFFTSGTTGKPKGIVASHANLSHYIQSAIDRYRFDQHDNFIAAARYTFSISLFELLVPLAAGANVAILPREKVLDLRALAEAVEDATVFHFGPSLLKLLLPYIEDNYPDHNRFSGLRHVSSGGDMVPPEILEKMKRIFARAEVYVIYGSSEISCMGCTWEVPRHETITATRVGRPFENTCIRILDEHGNSLPAGATGQVHFSGPGLVPGYLNNPAMTAERFYQHDGRRWYAIGDMGRLDERGNLQLAGREDFQINICGMRVETLEIEYRLKQVPGIRDCVVYGRALEEGGEKTVVAYVVTDDKVPPTVSGLNAHLEKYLPDYMLPSVYVLLDRLPTNHNAKIDRSQLPKPTLENMLIDSAFQAAESEIELALIKIWESLFGIQGIGAAHDFFDLGGDSIKAVQLLTEIDQKFQVAIPIAALLENATVRQLADIIAGKTAMPLMESVSVIKPGDSALPALFMLYGILNYRELVEGLDIPNMVYGITKDLDDLDLIEGDMSSVSSETACSLLPGLIDQYYHAIRQYQPKGPYYLCGHSLGGFLALEVGRRLRAEGEEVRLIAMIDTWPPKFLSAISTLQRIGAHIKTVMKTGPSHIVNVASKNWRRLLWRFRKYIPGAEKMEDPNPGCFGVRRRKLVIDDYPLQYFDGSVLILKAEYGTEFHPRQDDLGWSKYISDLEVYRMPSDHYGIMKGETAGMIAQVLSEKMTAPNTPVDRKAIATGRGLEVC